MLYNEDWDKTKTSNPFELETLIAWLKRRDPEEQYEYRHCGSCLLAQYFTAYGWKNVTLSKNFVTGEERLLPDRISHVSILLPPLFNWIAEQEPHDFGHALARAELARDEPCKAAKAAFSLTYGW